MSEIKTIHDAQLEYSTLAAQLGNVMYKVSQLEKQIAELNQEALDLVAKAEVVNKKAAELSSKESE